MKPDRSGGGTRRPAGRPGGGRRFSGSLGGALALLLWLLPLVAAAAVPTMQVDPAWPKPLPHGWELGEVSGISVDAGDHVWIIQRPNTASGHPAPPVIELDAEGRVMQAWGGPDPGPDPRPTFGPRNSPGPSTGPSTGPSPGPSNDWVAAEHGIYVDPQGFVWIAGNGPEDGQVLKFTAAGRFVLRIGHPGRGAASNDVTRLGRPTGVAVDPAAHEVYVADGYANHRVIVFDSETGAYKRHWGAYGKVPADDGRRTYDPALPPSRQFGNPVHCVKLAQDGLIYVCDRKNDRVQVFHKDGSFVTEWFVAHATRGLGSVWDLALWPDAGQTLAFVADGQNERIHVLRRADGAVLGGFGQRGDAPGAFRWVHAIAIDSKGDLFTTEVKGTRHLQRFVPAGVTPR